MMPRLQTFTNTQEQSRQRGQRVRRILGAVSTGFSVLVLAGILMVLLFAPYTNKIVETKNIIGDLI